MKKKLLVSAVAAALVAPSAFAAQDTAGMQYTSAAEGFYASIRTKFTTAGNDNDGGHIGNGGSRIGIRGTNDLGGGLSGFYQYEMHVGTRESSGLDTRLGHVGLRGAFGELVAGTIWTNSHNWVYGTTDQASDGSGNNAYDNDRYPSRTGQVMQYTTPDLNGFQGALLVQMDAEQDGEGAKTVSDADNGIAPAGGGKVADAPSSNDADDNDVDLYVLAAKYSVQGFDVAASYTVNPDHLVKTAATTGNNPTAAVRDNLNTYAVRLGYAQDNWYVNGWYGADNLSDSADTHTAKDGDGNRPAAAGDGSNVTVGDGDSEFFSLAAGIAVDKVNLYAVHDTSETGLTDTRVEDSTSIVGVVYNLGTRSRVWVDYISKDLDSDPGADDVVSIGLRHDF